MQTMDFPASLWRQDGFLTPVPQYEEDIEILSLDIFDTLLLRACQHPTDVFLEVARKGSDLNLLRKGLTSHEFKEVRILAERKARAMKKKESGTREVNLAEIYRAMPANLGNLSELQRVEIECEKFFCYLNPSVYSLAAHLVKRKKRLVLLSDMYLSSAQIREILAHNHFPLAWLDLLLVSNEEGGGKASGHLFGKLLEAFPEVEPRTILHVGDSKEADCDGATLRGINAIYYGSASFAEEEVFEVERVRHGVFLPEIASLRHLANHLCAHHPDTEKFWYRTGAVVLGPFLAAFCDWILDSCTESGISNIFPMMREGALLSQVLTQAAEGRGTEIQIRPVFISRLVTSLPALASFGAEDVENFFERRYLTVRNLFASLGLVDGLQCFSEYASLPLKRCENVELGSGRSLKDELIEYLSSEEVAREIMATAKKKRAHLTKYLLQTCGDLSKIAMVDVGYKGTIQKNLGAALDLENIDDGITHFIAVRADKAKEALINGIDIRGFSGSAEDNSDLIRAITRTTEILEQLLMDEQGSTVDYREENGAVVPQTEEPQIPTEEIRLKKICQQGILEYHELWRYLRKLKPGLFPDLTDRSREFTMILHRLIDLPTVAEASGLGGLHTDNNYGSDRVSVLCSAADAELLKKLGEETFISRCQYGHIEGEQDYRDTYWPQGAVTRHNPSFLFKKHLEWSESCNYLKSMGNMAALIKEEGIDEIIVYGAGEAGQSLVKASMLHGLKVKGIVDRRQSVWGQSIEGVEIMSLDRAVTIGVHTYAIGSFSFSNAIISAVQQKYLMLDRTPRIFTVPL